MPRKILLAFSLLFLFCTNAWSQACNILGQTPQTAFPVCGVDTFHQANVPTCGNGEIQVKGCPPLPPPGYTDKNPFWYRFTCFVSGTLGFLVTPNKLEDDYDWQLFDITGQSPNDVYTNPSLAITANWSGNTSLESARGYTGVTGTTASATDIFVCATNPQELGLGPPYTDASTFSRMPTLIQGHTYLLMVSHYTDSQSGYGLSFGGGTASITDTVKPAMQIAHSNCSGESIYLKLNKKMKCSTLALTDFFISPLLANVKSVTGIGCSSGFDMDSVIINLDNPLPPGNYSVIIKKGSDSSTLLDNCDNAIPEFDSVPLTVFPLQPTPMDSIGPVLCAPNILQLVFRNPMRCNSIAANGSDFTVNGTQAVSIASAYGVNCSSDGFSNIIAVQLTQPIQTAGAFILSLHKGSDGNTIIDECAQETPPDTLAFITADTVSAAFAYSIGLGCIFDTLQYAHDGRNNVNQWSWTFDINGTSITRDSFFLFNDYGSKHIQLACSNGVCTDTSAADILLDNELISRFLIAPSQELCPEDAAAFTDSSFGKIVTWYWTFGDGSTSGLQAPPQKMYPRPSEREGRTYPVGLIVKNDIGCFDTAQINLKVLYNCYIAVPTAFTPNGDGLNDFLYPLNAYKADNLEFRVYNRYGQLVFETKDWTRKWDGKINGNPQGSGTYVWMLSYTDRDTGKKFALKGTTVLIR
jgi:gliding motility-associated-like protein